ncbi:hypothetical protein AOLI_G00316690 [Acnodon oligacanthus]
MLRSFVGVGQRRDVIPRNPRAAALAVSTVTLRAAVTPAEQMASGRDPPSSPPPPPRFAWAAPCGRENETRHSDTRGVGGGRRGKSGTRAPGLSAPGAAPVHRHDAPAGVQFLKRSELLSDRGAVFQPGWIRELQPRSEQGGTVGGRAEPAKVEKLSEEFAASASKHAEKRGGRRCRRSSGRLASS